MKKICFKPNDIKSLYPELLGKYTDDKGAIRYKNSVKLLAAELALYYELNSIDYNADLPSKEDFQAFLVEHNKDKYFSLQKNIVLPEVQTLGKERIQVYVDNTLLNMDFGKIYGIEPEPSSTIERQEQCAKEFSFQDRQDATEFLYRLFRDILIKEKTYYTEQDLKSILNKHNGVSGLWSEIYNDLINRIIRYTNSDSREAAISREVSRYKQTTKYSNTPEEELKRLISDALDKRKKWFTRIVNNFTALTQDCNYKLLMYEDIRVNPKTSEVETSVIEKLEYPASIQRDSAEDSMEVHARGSSFSDDYNTVSSISTLSRETRSILNNIKQLNPNGTPERSPIGNFRYMDGSVVHAIILDACKDMIDEDDLEPSLGAIRDIYPWVSQIIDLFHPKNATNASYNEASRLKTLFFRDMNRNQVIYYGEFRNSIDDENNKSFISKPLNRSILHEYLLQRWSDNYQGGHILTKVNSVYNVDRTLNKTAITNLANDLQNLRNTIDSTKPVDIKSDTFETIKHILNAVAIDVSDNTLLNYLNNPVLDIRKANIDSLLFNLTGLLKEFSKKNTYGKNTDIIEDFGGYYKDLAFKFRADVKNPVEPNLRDRDTTRYTFVQDNHIHRLVKKLKNIRPNKKASDPRFNSYFEEFLNNEFKQYDWFFSKKAGSWYIDALNDFEKDKAFRDNFNLGVILRQDNTEAGEFRSIESLISQITEYRNGVKEIREDPNNTYTMTRYIAPLAAEAGVIYTMTLKRYNGTDEVNKRLVKILIQEINRILECRKRKELYLKGILKDSDLIDNYDRLDDTPGKPEGGKKFHFFPQLNTQFSETEEHPIIKMVMDLQNSGKSTPDIEAALLSVMSTIMENSFKEELKRYKAIGIMETSKGNNIYLNMPEANVEEFLKLFFYNSCYAQVQMIELLGTDLAFYKDHADFIKRAKEYHATGTRCNPSAVWFTDKTTSEETARVSDGNMRFIIANDVIKPSVNLDVLNALFDTHNMNAAEKKVAIGLFSAINSTDAQSFRTLKSYRKVMVMLGKWSEELENTYNRIRSGEWSWSDINTMFGAIKPYVYSSIKYTWRDENGNDHNIKQNLQIKTAEAALLTLYTQICTMGKNSEKLKALVNFMENEGGNDIDVLVFESAVKHGGQGKLDLEGSFEYEEAYVDRGDGVLVKKRKQDYDNSPEGVKAMLDYLESTTQLHSPSGINHNVVHSIPYRDYLEQQQVPEHIFDTIQIVGTQLRKLVTADIQDEDEIDVSNIPGLVEANGGNTKIKFRELLNLYNRIITENVLQSFNELRNDFMSLEKIEELLKDQIMNSSEYSPDLLNACTLVSDGHGGKMFNIPLHDQIQSNKLQAVFSAVLKNNITRQTIKGGACVQVAAYTYDLNVVLKDNNGKKLLSPRELKASNPNITQSQIKEYYRGHIDHVECYLPAYSKEIVDYLMKRSKDGLLHIEDIPKNIRDKVCRMIGYRIPTEDKYSMLPLKVVGFLPQSCSSTIMLPADWIAISGSDFDVDKLYMMFRELYTDSEGNLGIVSYDYSKLPQEQNDINGTALAKRNNAYIDLVEAILCSEHSVDKILDPGHFINKKIAARITRIAKNLPLEAIDALKLQYSKDGNPITNQELYNVLCKMGTKDLDSILKQYETPQNPLAPSTWAINRERIANSGSMIGVYANHNVNHALLQHTNVAIKESYRFTIDGSDERMLNLHKSNNGLRILKHNAENIGASVDDVKDPTLADTNVNMFTGDIDALLSDLGKLKPTVSMLLNQPIILEMTNRFMQHNSGESKFDVIDNVLNTYMTRLQNRSSVHVEPRKLLSDYIHSLNTFDFSGGDLFNNILVYRMGEQNPAFISTQDYTNYLRYEYRCGVLFNRLMEIANDLADIVRWCKADTTNGAAGPDFATTNNKIMLGRQILDKASKPSYTLEGVADKGKLPIIKLDLYNPEKFDLDSLRNMILESPFPITQAMYTCGIEAGNEFFKNLFPYYRPAVQDLLRRFEGLTRSGKLEPRLKNLILRDLTLYWLTGIKDSEGNGMFDIFWDENGNPHYAGQNGVSYGDILHKWIYEFPSILEKRKAEYGDNINPVLARLIRLLPNSKQNRRLPDIAFRNVGHLNTNSKWIAATQLYDLIDHGDTNSRLLAKQLMVYAGLKNGFSFGPHTYIHLANTMFRKEAHPLYIRGLRSMLDFEFNDFLSSPLGNNEYFYEFLYNHLDERSLVPEVDLGFIPVKIEKESDIPSSFTIKNVSNLYNNQYFTDRVERNTNTILEFICINYKDNLYYFRRDPNKFNEDKAKDEAHYINILPIGIKNELLAYHRTNNPNLNDVLRDLWKAGSPSSLNESTPIVDRGDRSPSTAPSNTEEQRIVSKDMLAVRTAPREMQSVNATFPEPAEHPELNNSKQTIQTITTKQAIDQANGFIGEVNRSPYIKVGNTFVTRRDTPTTKALGIITDRGHDLEVDSYGEPYTGKRSYNIGYESGSKTVMSVTNRDLFDEGWTASTIMVMRETERLVNSLDTDTEVQLSQFPNATFLVDANDLEAIKYLQEKGYSYKIFSDQQTQTTMSSTTPITTSTLFKEEPTIGYRNRTIKNARADATIAFAIDFNSAGERLTKNSVLQQGKKYIPVDTNNPGITDELVESIVSQLNEVNAKSLNIAGNGIYTLKGKYTQEQVDNYVYELLSRVINSPNLKTPIATIRSGGQTGYDEAGIKAAQKLGIVNGILAPKGWKFRDINGRDITDEQAFKARFNTTTDPQPTQLPTTPTASYGVEVSNGSQDFWNKVNQGWLSKHPNGIIAYRLHGDTPQSFTPEVVNSGWIGNPFNWKKVGVGVATTRFYNWLKNGNTYNEPNATEAFRQAIIQKIFATPVGSPILYYKELGRPSHATVIGYLIANKQLLQNNTTVSQLSKSETYDTFGDFQRAISTLRKDSYVNQSSIKTSTRKSPDGKDLYVITYEELPEDSSEFSEEKPVCGGTASIGSGNHNNTLDQVINNFNN